MPWSLSTRNISRNAFALTDKVGKDFIKKAIKEIQDCLECWTSRNKTKFKKKKRIRQGSLGCQDTS